MERRRHPSVQRNRCTLHRFRLLQTGPCLSAPVSPAGPRAQAGTLKTGWPGVAVRLRRASRSKPPAQVLPPLGVAALSRQMCRVRGRRGLSVYAATPSMFHSGSRLERSIPTSSVRTVGITPSGSR
ncbi:hypothetical protein GCM10027269_84390 [Kribbella endophytica]